MNFLCSFLVKAGEISDDRGIKGGHRRDSNKVFRALFRIEFSIVH
jgi:hypothetical protein